MTDKLHDALIEYDFEGARYSFAIPCTSWQDAEARVRAIRRSGRVIGWPCFSCPANPVTLPFVHAFAALFTKVRNALR